MAQLTGDLFAVIDPGLRKLYVDFEGVCIVLTTLWNLIVRLNAQVNLGRDGEICVGQILCPALGGRVFILDFVALPNLLTVSLLSLHFCPLFLVNVFAFRPTDLSI